MARSNDQRQIASRVHSREAQNNAARRQKPMTAPKSQPSAPESLVHELETLDDAASDEAAHDSSVDRERRFRITEEQKQTLIAAYAKGFAATEIVTRVEGISAWKARAFRISLGLTEESIRERRYATWRDLIRAGHSSDVVARIYDVRERSVRVMLRRVYGANIADIANEGQKERDAVLLRKLRRKNPFRW